jgi:lipoprotein NlpD
MCAAKKNPAICMRLLVLFLLLGVLQACGPVVRWDSQVYRVNKSETLYAIAWRYRLDYRDLARWNNIPPPYRIHPGQELILSDPAELPEHRRPPTQTAQTPKTNTVNKTVRTRVTNVAVKPPPLQSPPKKWIWPAQGKLLRKFAGERSTSQGIDIGGKFGQDILASADGAVVYSGSGLSGFGKLIIIKHNDTYISAYAHNSEILVQEGQSIQSGQKIAEMGKDQGSPRLHFEIRRQGKPVDPLKYLPSP